MSVIQNPCSEMAASILILLISLGGLKCLEASSKSLAATAIKESTESVNELQYLKLSYKQIIREELALSDIKNSLRRKLLAKNSNYLADLLCGIESIENQRRINNHIFSLASDFERPMSEAILQGAINIAYSCSTLFRTTHLLSDIFSEDDKKSYELVAIFYIHIYDVISNSPASRLNNMNFWPTFAFGLYKLNQHKLWSLMPGELKAKIERTIIKLPLNCQYLFFRPHFCLMNEKYSEFMYITISSKTIDSTSRHVWGWHEKWIVDDMGPMKATILPVDTSSSNVTNLSVQLKGIRNPLYYYMMPQRKLVAAWELPSEPVNSIWKIVFLDEDRVALYQQENIVCFTEEKYNAQRRQLAGYKSDQFSSESSECQWLLGKCDRR